MDRNKIRESLSKDYPKYLDRVLRRSFVNENGCWIWTGYTDPKTGYGQLRIYHEQLVKVHRFIAYCFHGLDLFNLNKQACHSCDIRNCINPFHIWIGTKKENFRDAVRKGRWHGGGGRSGAEHFTNNLKEKDWGINSPYHPYNLNTEKS